MSVSKTTTKFGLPLPQPGDMPDWYDFGAASQKLDDLAGTNNGIATLDANGNVVQMPAAAVPNTRKILGNPLSADITLAQLITAGLCPAPESGEWTPALAGRVTTGSPTYAEQYGAYVKINNLVFIFANIQLASVGGMTGGITLEGLPYSSGVCCSLNSSYLTDVSGLSGPLTAITNNGATAAFVSFGADGINWETNNWMQDNAHIELSGLYLL